MRARSNATASTPEHILDAWTALEVLSPPTFRRPEELAGGDRARLVSLEETRLPWEGAGERSRPNFKLYFQVVLGSIELDPAFSRLLTRFADARPERPAPRGEAILGLVTVNQDGRMVRDFGRLAIELRLGPPPGAGRRSGVTFDLVGGRGQAARGPGRSSASRSPRRSQCGSRPLDPRGRVRLAGEAPGLGA